jgi:trk/ktr system potassium uptake protein
MVSTASGSARANDELHGNILEKVGADIVVYPEREMGIRTAHGMTLRDVSDYMSVSHQYGVAKLPALPYLVGEKLSELAFGSKGKWEVAVLLIQRNNEVIVTPTSGEVIKPDDVLIVAGNDDKIEKLLSEVKKNKRGD